MQPLAHEQFARLERDHWWMRGRRSVYLGLLAHMLREAPPRRVLDLGSGSGGFLEGLARLAGARPQVVALDAARAPLEGCRARGGAQAVQALGSVLPFADASFDLVCLFDVLEHLDDDVAALAEVRRVLRPNGRVFASVPAYPWLFADNDRVAAHRRRYTRRGLAQAFEGAGLAPLRNTHTNALLLPAIVPVVLASKAWQSLRRRGAPRSTNLSWPMPRGVNELCYRAFSAELPLVRRMDLPLGHSIAILAARAA